MNLYRIVLDDRFIRPRYNGCCFADLPATIKWVLTPAEVEIPLLLCYF